MTDTNTPKPGTGKTQSTTPSTNPTSTATAKSASDTKDVKSNVQDTAKEMKDKASAAAQDAKSAAARQANEATEAVKAKAGETVENARSDLAASTEDTADRVREAGDAFEPNSLVTAAADRIADNLSQAASAVRTADLGSLQDDLTEFARRNPLIFFGGAAALGFLVARMMKASERAETSYDSDTRFAEPTSTTAYPERTASPTGSQHQPHTYAGSQTARSDRASWGYS